MEQAKKKTKANTLYGLTDLGNIVKLSVRDEKDEDNGPLKVIDYVLVLNLKTNKFSEEYSKEDFGDIVKQTISSNPKDIFDRLSSAKTELEKKELALMKNLFLVGEFPDKPTKTKRTRKKKEDSNE